MFVNFLNMETLSDEISTGEDLSKIDLDRVAVIILGGGEGKRLEPLTQSRCKPAISFGGRYTLIDVPISHSLTTGLKNIFVIGQYLAYSLQKHLFQTYLYNGISQNQIHLLIPEERNGEKVWYKGTADAIRQNLHYLSEVSADYYLILSGDQLYNINFLKMINFAVDTNASMVIATQPIAEKDAKRMGLLKLKEGSTELIDFVEKPKEKEILDQYALEEQAFERLGLQPNNKKYLGSMGIYLFKKQALFDLLTNDPREDFGNHLIKTQMKNHDVHAFIYDGYWEDIGTIESYYNANLALTHNGDDIKRGLRCYDEKSRIFTKSYTLPGAKIRGTLIEKAIICEGSIVDAQEVIHSIVGVRSVIGKGTIIRDSIIMGNEYYHSTEGMFSIGPKCIIQKAIIDENVVIGKNVKLVNHKGYDHYDCQEGEPSIYVRDGIIIVPKGSVIPDGYVF